MQDMPWKHTEAVSEQLILHLEPLRKRSSEVGGSSRNGDVHELGESTEPANGLSLGGGI